MISAVATHAVAPRRPGGLGRRRARPVGVGRGPPAASVGPSARPLARALPPPGASAPLPPRRGMP